MDDFQDVIEAFSCITFVIQVIGLSLVIEEEELSPQFLDFEDIDLKLSPG